MEQSAEFRIPCSFGSRNSEYRLVACSDASKEALGCCFYLWDLKTNTCIFLAGKNHMVGRNLRTKSIPVLELVALAWATEVCMEFYKFLTGTLEPIKIENIIIYCDSSISLCWVRSRVTKNGKVERKSVLVNNKLNKIIEVTNLSGHI